MQTRLSLLMQILTFWEDLQAGASLQLPSADIWGAAGLLPFPHLRRAPVGWEAVDGEEIRLDGEGN